MTRAVRSPDEMIRFVLAPDGTVVPDMRRRLPGRGVWVSAERSAVGEAVRRKVFARGFKGPAQADGDLPDVVDALLADTALRSLSMARKSGALVTGSTKIDGLIRENDCAVLLHASDAAPDGKRKLNQAVTAVHHMGGEDVLVLEPFTVEAMSLALGMHNVVHAGIRHGPAGAGTVRHLTALARYRNDDPPPGHDPGAGESARPSAGPGPEPHEKPS